MSLYLKLHFKLHGIFIFAKNFRPTNDFFKTWSHLLLNESIPVSLGRAVAQAVSRWLPTTAARVRVLAACGIVADKAALGQVFSEYFGFPCQSFHQFLHHHNHPGLAQ
jgi:hypothetical protein